MNQEAAVSYRVSTIRFSHQREVSCYVAAMRRDEAMSTLKQCKQQLAAIGVRSLYLFGSVARDDATPGSDIDLLVEPADGSFTIFDLGLVRDMLLRELNSPVDVHDYGGYVRLPDFRAKVGRDIVRVF